MALIDRLNSSLQFSPVDISTAFSGLSPDAPSLDTGALTATTSPLQQLDLGPMTAALAAVAQQGQDHLGGLADLQQVEAVTSDSTLAPVAQLTRSLSAGAIDLSGTLPTFAEKGRALAQLMGAVAGLMTIWSQVQRMVETAERIVDLLPPDDLQHASGQLAAWFDNSDLNQRITTADPNDATAVAELVASSQPGYKCGDRRK